MSETVNNAASQKVPRRILASLLSSLSAGVVPRSGAPYIAIGRTDEIGAMLTDLEHTDEGGGAMRFLVGRYGSGKSFLIQLIRGFALDRGFVCADADLSPERRFSGSGGSGLATYRELAKNIACKSSPDGGALPVIISKWLSGLKSDLAADGIDPASPEFASKLDRKIYAVIGELEGQVGGFDFAAIMVRYCRAAESGDDAMQSACLRWLRGEYSTKTEARQNLGFAIGSIVDDDTWYDYIKLLAMLFRKTGYRGFVVFIDECVNLYKISNRISRENNYEKILSMFNDTLQGRAPYLMMVLGGTPQFMEDPRRGLFSYEALRSRLCDSRFDAAGVGLKNLMSPVVRLRRLSDDELLALMLRLTRLHGQYYSWEPRISDSDRIAFLTQCLSRTGASEMLTPREVIRDYMTLLNILYQNPNATADAIMQGINTSYTAPNEEAADASADTSAMGTPPGAENKNDPVPRTPAAPVVTLDDIEI